MENFSIYYSKRAWNIKKCGDRDGEMDDKNMKYGTTRFHKIRIDIHTLRVLTNDYTFADTSGTPQPFGTAGDCYSNNLVCPQGDFSINLEGTKFRIRPNTVWEVNGQNSAINYVIKVSEIQN